MKSLSAGGRSLVTRTVIVDVVTQHAEEAAFLWLLRDDAVAAPHYDLEDLRKLDERVAAHLDGLRIAGEPGWQICKEQLLVEEPGEVFAAAVMAFESGDPERIGSVVEVAAGSRELSRAMASALGWLEYDQTAPHVPSLLESSEPLLQRAGIAATAVHRKDPGPALLSALRSDDDAIRSRALVAVGELGRADGVRLCREQLQSGDHESRFGAAWSMVRLGDAASTAVLREMAEAAEPHGPQAGDLAARAMKQGDALAWRQSMSGRAETIRLAIIVAGAAGDPASVPWLMEMMAADEFARPAGEAFSVITGADLAYDDLERDWPEGFEAGPTENPEDEDVAMDPDEDLPWPDPELLGKWWSENRGRFQTGTRCLLGKPITHEWMQEVLRIGKQRQRAAAALEIALMRPGEPLFEVRAPGDRQKRLLAC